MSGEQDVAAIAAGLTKPQRRALVSMTEGETRLYRDINGQVRVTLFRKRLLRHAGDWVDGILRAELTPRGAAVRAHLLSDTPTQVNEGDR